MPREVYIPPPRPFASQPTPQTIPSAPSLGLTGAEAWAYDVDTRVQCDPGRWELFNMIQGGMIWLDNYVLEIQRRVLQAEEENEEVDFVDLVKTPGRNKKAPQTISQASENAERLAKINALHFGEMERLSPVKPSTLKVKELTSEKVKSAMPTKLQAQDHNRETSIPASNTDQTIRPLPSPKEDFHVMAHAPPTPVPLLPRKNSIIDLSIATTKAPLSLETGSSFDSRPSQVPSSSQQAPSSQPSSQQGPSSGNDKRFGPRPLPAVPSGGMRSRTASNASMMSTTATRIGSDRPLSRTGVHPQSDRNSMFNINASSQQPEPPQAVAHPTSVPAQAAKSKPIPVPRTPSPIPLPADEDDDDMEVEVEIPLNDTTVHPDSKEDETIPVFPSILNKKHSFASLPNPSPLKKSVRGTSTQDKEGNSSATAKTPNANSSGGGGSRPSVRPSSGWLKNTATTVTKKTKGGEKAGDLVTALNTAANATTVGLAVTGGNAGLKRKSEVHDESEERVTKLAKKSADSYVSAAVTPGSVVSASTTPGTAVSAATAQNEKDFAADPEEDTATRLLKLRGRLNSVSSSVVTGVEIGEGRSRDGPAKQGNEEHSRERSGGASRPVSRAMSDRTRVNSDAERVSESRLSKAVENAKEKASLTRQPSVEKRSETVLSEEARSSGVKAEEKKSKVQKREDEFGSGFGLPKFNIPTSATFGQLAPLETSKSTTPHGSPLPPPSRLPTKNLVGPKSATEKEKAVSNDAPSQEPIFKPLKGSIFSALSSKVDKSKGPAPIFSRAPSQQFIPVTYFAGPQYGVETQSTDTESQSQSVFDGPISNRPKTSNSTMMTEASRHSEGDKVVPVKMDDNTGTTMKSGGTDHFSGWGEEGLTATWLSKGDETTGGVKKSANRMPGTFTDEEEEEGGNWEEEDPENITNHRWNALKAEAMGGHQREIEHEEDHLETPIDDEDEEMIDGDDEDEIEEVVQDEEAEEIVEEEEEPPKPAPVASGIMASIGSLTSKFGLKSLRAAAVNAEKEKAEKEKREARLKEIEARRRAAALQKKAEEEAKQKELEKKRKADEDKRKKDKADTTLTRSFKPVTKPTPTVPSSDKKPELKKQPSKLGLGGSTLGASSSKLPPSIPSNSKRAPTPTKASTIKLIGQNSAASTSSSALPLLNPSMNLPGILGPTTSTKPGTKVTFQSNSSIALKNALAKNGSTTSLMGGKTIVRADIIQQTSTKTERVSETGIDESADLPDIKSEYSDSEDESRPRSYNPPIWAQSPDLRQALEDMRTVNPDTIFGAMPQLKMDEIFPGRRKSKFRARTSSANWAGTDGVTVEEEIAYAKRMGFQS